MVFSASSDSHFPNLLNSKVTLSLFIVSKAFLSLFLTIDVFMEWFLLPSMSPAHCFLLYPYVLMLFFYTCPWQPDLVSIYWVPPSYV